MDGERRLWLIAPVSIGFALGATLLFGWLLPYPMPTLVLSSAMIDFPAFADVLSLLSTSWEPCLVVIPGLIIGLVFGCIPGLQSRMEMAVFLPATLSMDFLTALLFLQ